MKIGVIGMGNIGTNLATQWARRGHDVFVSFKRDPAALAETAGKAGARWGSVAEAVDHGEAVLLAVPWATVDSIASQATLDGKVLVDATNPFAPGGLALREGTTSAEVNAARFPGARLVKAFNTYTAGFQATVGDGDYKDPVAMFLGGEDGDAKAVAADLIRDAGFEPVDIGGWSTISLMEAPRRPGGVYGEEFRPDAARRIAEAAATDLAEASRLADELKIRE
jgi:8-hydroxy-5-deazaflavin:NADPH oxidoreductase